MMDVTGGKTMAFADSNASAWHPQSELDRQIVLEQLNRVLSSAGFSSSQRYPGLLRYVVEQTLVGHEDTLKERSLGIEVFHRAPDYDTSQDPVVRLSAAEVRKRLALYYQSPEHQQELVIGLNPGSYVPFFRPVDSSAPTSTQEKPAVPPARPVLTRRSGGWLGVAALAVVLGLGFAWYGLFRPSINEQFWWPILNSTARVTVCVGVPEAVNPTASASTLASTVYDKTRHSGRLSKENVSTLIPVGAILEQHHRSFRLTIAHETGFPELREGPVVLVGALDNPWTMRLTQPLRYGFAMDNTAVWIVDHKNPTAKNWSVLLNQPSSSQPSDYAIIARYFDSTLDQPVVLVAGLSSEGTEAMGEILTDPGFLRQLLQKAPGNWKSANLEAVIQTQVIEGHPGPSRILAVESW